MAGAVLAAATGAGVAGASSSVLPSAALHDYAVLGLEGVTLRGNVSVQSGDVGSNSPSGIVTLMRRARVAGAVAGNTIRFGRGASAAALFCQTLEQVGPGAATCTPMEPPLFSLADLPAVQVTPGSLNVRLLAKSTGGPLVPGRYGAIRVGNGAQLTLEGGDYEMRTLWVGKRSELVCKTPCVIRIAKRAVIKESALVASGSSRDPASVRLEVGGHLGRRAVLRVFRRAFVEATMYAPKGSIVLGMNGRYTGPIIGRKVLVYQRSHILGPGEEPPDPRNAP